MGEGSCKVFQLLDVPLNGISHMIEMFRQLRQFILSPKRHSLIQSPCRKLIGSMDQALNGSGNASGDQSPHQQGKQQHAAQHTGIDPKQLILCIIEILNIVVSLQRQSAGLNFLTHHTLNIMDAIDQSYPNDSLCFRQVLLFHLFTQPGSFEYKLVVQPHVDMVRFVIGILIDIADDRPEGILPKHDIFIHPSQGCLQRITKQPELLLVLLHHFI